MAAKPRTPATRDGANGSLVARLKAEVRTLCLVWGGAGERAPEGRVSPGAQNCPASLPRAEAVGPQGSQRLRNGLVTNKWGRIDLKLWILASPPRSLD